MNYDIFVPIALVLGLVGAVCGALSFWEWLLLHRWARGNAVAVSGSPNAGAWRKLQQDVAGLARELAALRQRLEAATGLALQRVDVDYGSLPGQTAPNSVIVALRDASGRNGVMLNVYGNPQFRVLALRDGTLQSPPDGQILDMEARFWRRLVEQS